MSEQGKGKKKNAPAYYVETSRPPVAALNWTASAARVRGEGSRTGGVVVTMVERAETWMQVICCQVPVGQDGCKAL